MIPEGSPLSALETSPMSNDLPSKNAEEVDYADDFHFLEPILLFLAFLPANWTRERVYSASSMNLYYDGQNPRWYKRPDWFGVVGVPKLYENRELRLIYVSWQEGVNPFVVVELLSPETEAEDLCQTPTQPGQPPSKWEVYQTILRVPYYVVFNRYTNELQGFRLVGGSYERMNFSDGRLLIPELGLSLGLWQGSFQSIELVWLRWFTLEGELILIPEEQLQEANTRADKLAERLRDLGVNPDE